MIPPISNFEDVTAEILWRSVHIGNEHGLSVREAREVRANLVMARVGRIGPDEQRDVARSRTLMERISNANAGVLAVHSKDNGLKDVMELLSDREQAFWAKYLSATENAVARSEKPIELSRGFIEGIIDDFRMHAAFLRDLGPVGTDMRDAARRITFSHLHRELTDRAYTELVGGPASALRAVYGRIDALKDQAFDEHLIAKGFDIEKAVNEMTFRAA